MKSIGVKWKTNFDFDAENNDKDSRLKVGDHVRIWSYRDVLQKATIQIGLKKFLW